MIYRWRDNTCNPGTGGQWPDFVRLPLVEVLDPSGNKLVYNWEGTASNAAARFGADDTWQDDHNCNYVRTVRLKDIRYNFDSSGAEQNLIQLRYDNAENPNNLRYDRPNYFPAKAMSLYAIYKLLGVDIQVTRRRGIAADGTLVQPELLRPVRGWLRRQERVATAAQADPGCCAGRNRADDGLQLRQQ